MKIIVIPILSIVLFFISFMLFSQFIDDEIAAWIAGFMMYIGFPLILMKLWKDYPNPEVVAIDREDPKFLVCIEHAQKTLPYFLGRLNEGKQEAFIKYSVTTKNNNIEHVWGVAHSTDNNFFITSLINTPVEEVSDDHNLRQKIPFEQVEDWMLMNIDNTCEGGFTHLAQYQNYIEQYGKFPKKYHYMLEGFVDIDFENQTFKN